MAVEILAKTRRAWTCFFANLELIFAPFFLFFVLKYPCFTTYHLLKIRTSSAGGKGMESRSRFELLLQNSTAFNSASGFHTLPVFWFLRMPGLQFAVAVFSLQYSILWKWEASSKSNALLPSVVAVARASVLFLGASRKSCGFIFWEPWCLIVLEKVEGGRYEKVSILLLWASWEPWKIQPALHVIAAKNNILAGDLVLHVQSHVGKRYRQAYEGFL